MTKVICMNENPQKERKRIVYNTCTYVLRLAFIKEKKIENGDYVKVHI